MARKYALRITKRTTYEQFLAEAQRLKGQAETAETEFFSYLYDAERVPAIWQDTGYSFIQLLRHTNLCPVSRYRSYKVVRDGQGERAIADVGIHAVIQAGRLPDLGQQRDAINEAKLWEKSNGSTISPDSAKKIVDGFRVREAPRRVVRQPRAEGAEDMAAENTRLRAENEMLRAEARSLRAENEKLQAENRRLRSRSGDRSRRPSHAEA